MFYIHSIIFLLILFNNVFSFEKIKDYNIRSSYGKKIKKDIQHETKYLYSDPTDPIPDGSMVEPSLKQEYKYNEELEVKGAPPILIEDESEKIEIPQNWTQDLYTKDVRFGGTAVGVLWEQIALVYNAYKQVVAGPAAIINANWVLSSSTITPDGTPAIDLKVYVQVRSGAAGELLAERKHGVKEIKVNPDKNGYYSTMMLMKCCPTIVVNQFAKMPLPTRTYTPGVFAEYINFVPTMTYHRKKFGETCECDALPGWDPVRSVCMQESNTIYSLPTEKGSLLFYDYIFVGTNLYQTSDGGEAFTWMAKYLSWLSSTAGTFTSE